jgi:hypothetical protein
VADEKRRLLSRRALTITGAVLLLAGFVWLWWKGVQALYELPPGTKFAVTDQLKAITDTRTALLAGLAGLAALAGLTFTAGTYQLTQKGQLTDRYTKAIAQLGDDKPDVLLGGIYALEQLATDSDNVRATIVEVLSAFVRMHSDPVFRFRKHRSWLGQKGLTGRAEKERYEAEKHVAEYLLPVDVQAAVTVLGRLGAEQADLSDACLREAQLIKAILPNANLTGADLTAANLTGSDLTGSDLGIAVGRSRRQLVRLPQTGARLGKADLTKAKLAGARIGGALWGERTTTWPSQKLRDEIRNVSDEWDENNELRNELYGCELQVREGYHVGPEGASVCCRQPAPPTPQS